MISLGGIDFELATIAPNPEFNYEDEYVERKMLSGKVRRFYKGKRMTLSLSYAYLTDQQISNLYSLLDSQRTNGYIPAIITAPSGTFTGNVHITIDESQKRFALIEGKWVWSYWKVLLEAVDLIS